MWTKEAPGKDGFYWLRNYKFKGEDSIQQDPVIVSVCSKFDGPFEMTFTGNDLALKISELSESEWCGPLTPPE